MLRRIRSPYLRPYLLFAAGYLLLVFPFAWFRHDDWLILGNGLALPEDWSLLFSTDLLHQDGPHPWFFRPLFKLIPLILFKLFGYHYWAWLSFTLILTIAALWTGARAIADLRDDRDCGLLFVGLFTATIPLHFGSLTWAGEGMMNCPLLLLLALNTWCFCRGRQVAAMIFFLLSLTVKEAGLFHCAFLFGLVFAERPFRDKTLREKAILLLPYVVAGGTYLAARVLLAPLNPKYNAGLNWIHLAPALLVILGSLLFPVAVIGGSQIAYPELRSGFRDWMRALGKRYWYLPYLLVCFLPLLGYRFFSPGWMLYPGFFMMMVLALASPPLEDRRQIPVGFALVLLTALPVLYKLDSVNWWVWKPSQLRMHRFLSELPAKKVDTIHVYRCQNPAFPRSVFERVIGDPDGLYFMWKALHGTEVNWVVRSCWRMKTDESEFSEKTVVMRWDFPGFEVLKTPE